MGNRSRLTWRTLTASLATLALGGTAALTGASGAAAAAVEDTAALHYDDPAIEWAEITVDGEDVERDQSGRPYNTFGGLGAVSANNTSNLLLDYKEESPEAYWRIMHLLFDRDTGAGLNHIKVELGADTDTSSGAEPATKRSADEPADVLRGAGFHFIADAKTINPDIAVEALRWGEPSWTGNDTDLRYRWYKETIDAAYDTFGIEFDYLSPAQNELHASTVSSELEWTVEVAKRLQADATAADARYDYGEIKIVALDSYRMGEEVAGAILAHPEAVDYIDAIGIHYTIYGGPNLTELNKTHGMEVLYSEAVAPQVDPEYRIVGEPERGGIGGTAGAVDIADRIINAYRYEGSIENPAHFTSYLFQPAVSAMYEGTQYAPKHLIAATDPWSGYYEGNVGIVTARHFTQFIDEGWEYIENASYGDGAWADGGTAVDSSTRTYLTLRTPSAADGDEQLTQVHANNTSTARHFEVKVTNLDIAERLYAWQTTGPQDPASQTFDEEYFQRIGYLEPVRTEATDGVEYDVYQVRVEPYSILTLSTLENGLTGETEEYVSGQYAPQADNSVLELPYTDDFEYAGYPQVELAGSEMSYIERRSGSPRYTADQNGAFEVVDSGSERGHVLRQQIHANNRGYTWNVWGDGRQDVLSTATPATVLGDHTWANYTATVDFRLDDVVRDPSLENFAGLGVRQVVIQGRDLATYSARVYDDGRWELRKLDSVVASGSEFMFDPSAWHTLSLEARENTITLGLDGETLAGYVDTSTNPVMGGRISLVSGYYNTEWDSLEVTPIDGYSWYGEKIDDTSPRISYSGDTTFNRAGFGHFNRTTHTVRSGAAFSLDFEGSGLNIFGATGRATLDVTIDDGEPRRVTVGSTGDRQTSHWIRGLDESQPHSLHVAVVEGTFTLDGIDILTGGAAQEVDPAVQPVEVAEELGRLVTYVGTQPELPGTVRAVSAAGPEIDAPVTWAVADVDEAYSLVRVEGTFDDNPALSVGAHVEVVPTGLRYFVDSNAAAVTDGDGPFEAVQAFLAERGSTLLNDVPDQRFADGWGLRGDVSAKGPLAAPVYDKLRETGWYATNRDAPISYELALPAGTYEVASGHTEWWNHSAGRARNLLTEVTYQDPAGEETTERVGSMSWPHPSSGATHVASGQFTLAEDGTVTYTVRNNGGTEAPVISWLAVREAGEAADRTELASLLQEAQEAPRRAYTDESWTALRGVALSGRAVHDSPEATQDQVDAAAADLREALDALVEVAYIPPAESRVAVHTGQVPELPATVAMRTISGAEEHVPVTWDAVAPRAFDVPYGVVEVSGTAGTSAVTLRVEVVPEGLTYLIDAATAQAGIDSPVHEAVSALTPGLRNAAPDQVFDADGAEGWGLTSAIDSGDTFVSVKGVVAGTYDKYLTTGWWAGGNAGTVDYRLWLPEGTYELTAGYREWWGQTRHIDSAVTVAGEEISGPGVTLSGSTPQLSSTIRFAVPEDGYVDFTASMAAGSQQPVLSWLGVAEVLEQSEAALEALAVTSPPERTEYEVGEDLDLAGLEVTATYSDGSVQVVDHEDLLVTGYDPQTAGEQTVTVSFTDGDVTRSATFAVTVDAGEPEVVLEALAVTSPPERTEYEVGEDLDLAGLEVTATYSDGSVQVVDHEDLAVAGYDSRTTGEQTIAVAFTDGDVTRTATFTVTVTAGGDPAPTLEYIVVSTPPTTTVYHLGQNLDLAGLTVAAGYSDGTTVPVDPADLLVSGYDPQLEGEQTVTVSFTDGDVTERATFVVTVEPADGPPEPAPAPTDGPSPAPGDGPAPGPVAGGDLPSTGLGGGTGAVTAALLLLLTGTSLLLLRRRRRGAPLA